MAKTTKEKKRKPRTKLADKVDTLYPVDITKLGTEEDVCFGKLHDPKEYACIQCGDCELCQIVMAQGNHKLRAKVEAQGKFKDIEEKEIYDANEVDSKKLKNKVRAIIRENRSISFADLKSQIKDIFPTYDITQLFKLVKRLANKSDKFTLQNKQLIWKG